VILIVDDDPEFLDLAETDLSVATKGCFRASNATQAVNLIQKIGSEVGVALVDLRMPGVSGFELIRSLHQIDSTLPIIAISGVVSDKALESALGLGATETLRKPITGAWNDAIRRVRRKRSDEAPPEAAPPVRLT